MAKLEGIFYTIEQNRVREVEELEEKEVAYSGWNSDGVKVYIQDTEIESILPAVRILLPQFLKKRYSIVVAIFVSIGAIILAGFLVFILSRVLTTPKENESKMIQQAVQQVPLPSIFPQTSTGGLATATGEEIKEIIKDIEAVSPYIQQEEENFAVFDANMEIKYINEKYNFLSQKFDLAKVDLDECKEQNEKMKAEKVPQPIERAGRALIAYCNDEKRTENEKTTCGKLFLNIIK